MASSECFAVGHRVTHRAAVGLLAVALPVLASIAWAGVGFPADSLRIVAAIDGSDELHISHRSATWVHQSWGQPTDVRLNGWKWNPQQRPVLSAGTNGWLLNPALDLSGAVLHKLRGRGSVDLGRDTNGLVIRFDDPENGADTYEAEVLFAQTLARSRSTATNDLELRISARIDGMDEIWFAQDQGKWVHAEHSPPANVTANGRPWDIAKHPALTLNSALLPEVMDLQRATLTVLHGRGIVHLEYRPELLCLDFEDYDAGADLYEVVVRVPRVRQRHLVRLTSNVPDALLGAALKVYRFPATGEDYALLPGQRLLDARGQCLVALEPGQYQFELQHQPAPQMLVALKTGVVNICGPTNLDFKARRVEAGLRGPDQRPFTLDELLVRSTRPCGALTWKAPAGSNAALPTLLLSADQTYTVHAFGHAGTNYAALWTNVATADFPRLTLPQDQWRSCSFRWARGTPRATAKGVVLQFPDGQLEVPHPETARFHSNRRFLSVGYWLAFEGGRKAVFQPRGYILPESGPGEVALGGPLHPLASAAVLQDESLRPPGAQHLWWEIILADAQNYLLDPAASKIDWNPTLTTLDGQPAVTAPLLAKDVERLGNLKDTLIANASYRMGTTQHVSLHPEQFVRRQTTRCFTQVPPYRDWNTRAYLAKVERELKMIARARLQPLARNHRVELKWWFNSGAVGAIGAPSVTMPFSTYLGCADWFSHPWAIAHEMLHNFGYGHTHEMDRLDRDVQERVAQFQWHVADHPEYVPEEWEEPPRP